MFGQFSAFILNSLLKNKWLFVLVFVGIVATLISGVSKLKVDEDVYSIFPKGEEYSQFNDLLKKNNLNRQVVFSFDSNEDVDLNYENLDQISDEMKAEFEKELSDFQVYKDVDQEALISHLQTTSISYLEVSDYQCIKQAIHPDSIGNALLDLNERLKGASSLFLGAYYSKDPLNLLGNTVQKIGFNQENKAYEVEDGIVYSVDKKHIFFFANLKVESKDSDALLAFEKKLKTFKEANKKLNFDYFGTFQITVENAVQVKRDTFLTLSISLLLIVGLLIFYYRSIVIPVIFVLPAAFGMLSGLGFVGFIQSDISAISIGTSSILLGIVLDYTFHFLTHFKHSGSLIETVKDIASPMLIGSFTTVAAFASLLFTDSIVLQNFGLIALFTLLGSALFTLFIFPVLLSIFKIKMVDREPKFPRLKPNKVVFRLMLLAVIGFTCFSLLYSSGVNFDADLNNLSYHSDKLKEKEDAFTSINPGKEKKIYVFSKGKTRQEANVRNEQVFRKLVDSKEDLKISEIVSTAAFNPSKEEFAKSKEAWIEFWQLNDSIKQHIVQKSDKFGFSETAFNPFFELLENPRIDESINWLQLLGMQNFVHDDGQEISILTSVVVDRNELDRCKSLINEVEGAFILDISEVASNMLDSVQRDFNFLLYFSSLLVLISLLVVYGRIELALFAFFPMLLAWVWIIGITSIFDIHFNFVNILIATFIFGLGDDFSIFVTDGLIQKYRTGKDSLKSYKSAIILSGLTTIFGTGCLYFAKHPAIHSIAIVSVVGILTILFITLAIQPAIFNWFVTRRINRGRGPITFFTFIYSLMLFIYFFLGSMFLSIFLIFVLIPLPIRKKKKVKLLNYMVSKLAKSTLYAGFHIKKQVLDSSKLNYNEPSIVIANHSSFLDILAVLMLDPKTIIMVKKWVYNSPVFGLFIRYSGYIFAEEGAEGNLDVIKERVKDGYSIVIFPEGTRSPDGEIKRFHKGAFLLSLELNIPIQPVLLIGIHEVNPKNDVMINRGTIIVQPLNKLYPNDYDSYQHYSKQALKYMRSEFQLVKQAYAKTDFWFPQIIRNFVLKGPVLEWYVRVKFKLEKTSFEFYDELISDRKRIYDVGCGYGYLSYYLHYRNKEREIIGLDYDEEKALTAQNALKKNENLEFHVADLRQFEYKEADAIFINDVLHYLPKNEQYETLQTMVEALRNNGILFIRDGIVDVDRIKNTKRTEQLSTKLFRFNKVENELTFISVDEMKSFAKENKLSFEMIEHSKTTSNVLFVMRK